MINKKAEVCEALKKVEGAASLFFYYPESFERLPAISYYETVNRPYTGADDMEYLSELDFIVDIWEKASSAASGLAQRVTEEMEKIGFRRVSARDVYKKGAAAHKNMRFKYIG